MASMLHCPATVAGTLATGTSASDLLRSSSNGISGVPLKDLGRARFGTSKRELIITSRIRKAKKRDYPWPKNPDPNVKGGILRHLSSFKPLKEKPKPVTLEFEKPLKIIQQKLMDIQKLANETGLDFSDQIMALENNYQKALRNLYKNLTPIQRVQIARHPNRPTFLDHIFNITEKFVELHGDRAGYDDPAIVTGLGTINGRSYMFMGHQKGRNTKENIKRNFGMPTPHGYRKALRMMYYADHHGFPIVTFIDTPGAFADLKCEELGQGEAIAHNLRTMFGLKVPVISIVIGEGGSGGALAIGCANKLIMLENAVFYVASPEACAAILWKSSKHAPRAAKKLRITAKELTRLKICDGVIPEPLGGAHTDPEWTSEQIKMSIVKTMKVLDKMEIPELLQHRMAKFRKIGDYKHFPSQLPKTTYDATNRSNPVIAKREESPVPKLDLVPKNYKLELPNAKALTGCIPGLASKVQLVAFLVLVKDLENAIILESSEAAKITGFSDKIAKLREEYNGVITSALQEKLNDLTSEFWQMLSSSPSFKTIESKLNMLSDMAQDNSIKKTNGFMFEVKEKVTEVLNRPDMKKKRDEVESLMKELGVSNLDSDDLDQNLKEKIDQLDLQLATETNYLIPYHLLIELLKETPASKEAGSVFKEFIGKYIEIKNRSDLSKKLQEVSSSDEPDKELKMESLRKQISGELMNIHYSIGLRELLKKVKADRDAGELIEELIDKFEGVLNRPDVKKKNEFLKEFKSKKMDPVMKKKVLKAKQDIVKEFAKVLNSLGLDKLLDDKLDVESLLKDGKEFENGSFVKAKVAVGTDGVEAIAEANTRFV